MLMRNLLLLLSLGLFPACSSTPSTEKEASTPAAQTTECLDNPELGKTWGDCNVKTAVYQASSQLQRCQKHRAAADTQGTISFELKVSPDGSVRSVHAIGHSGGKIVGCVSHVLKKLKFAAPPNGQEATIMVPYQLAPDRS